MGEKLVVGVPFNKGMRDDRTAFVIDNDSFPFLFNSYQWRGRVKRKRGTSLLTRLTRFFDSTKTSYSSNSTQTLDGTGSGNLLTGFISLETSASLVIGSISILDITGGQTYTDPSMNGTLTGSSGGTGTINYASGAFTITGGAGHVVSANFSYYPGLPVLGLEDFISTSAQFPGTIDFDTTYAYDTLPTAPYLTYSVSFYKNPAASSSLPGYTPKTNPTPVKWNSQNYQQVWTVNYQGALWATNGVQVPFTTTNIGMQYAPASTIAFISNTATTITVTISGSPLVVGDFVFFNEWTGTTAYQLNFQTGYVTNIAGGNITITVPDATLTVGTYTPGIIQYLTNSSSTSIDCLRWYDGDPTNGSPTTPVLNGTGGWVNFMPPISQLNFSIADLPPAQYYLVGAKVIFPFKDRLLFFGPVVQSSATPANPIYLPDTIVYSQDGTPYYTASFVATSASSVVSSATTYFPILVPTNETATPNAYFSDQTGFGGFITAGISQAINTVAPNQDVLILGFNRLNAKLIFTSNDITPFIIYIVNSEFGSSSTFSAVTMDQGVLTYGSRGWVITSQESSRRIDLEIPDEAFDDFALLNNGSERMTAQRDFINEWVYFTYPTVSNISVFPSKTFQYNYREDSWGFFFENYTTYGSFRKLSGYTWSTLPFTTWTDWTEPWNANQATLLQPLVIAGNQQGFVLVRDEGTGEGNSLWIQNISYPATITNIVKGATTVVTANNQFVVGQQVTFSNVQGMTQINGLTGTITVASPTQFTVNINSGLFSNYSSGGIATPLETIWSPNHALNDGDYIVISGCLGTVASSINGNIYSVANPTVNGFQLSAEADLIPTSGTYLGGGLIQRMYVYEVQTKQFPMSWQGARKTRIGPQQYLLTTTPKGQTTLEIFLSENNENAWNASPIVPAVNVTNSSLIYSTTLFTSPEYFVQNCNKLPLGAIGNGAMTSFSFNLFTLFEITSPGIVPGSVVVTVGNVATFTDTGNGTFTATGTGTSAGSNIMYGLGTIAFAFTVAPTSQVTTVTFQYNVTNILNPTMQFQQQIWHRMNTSLIGDTIQIGFTMSDAQMRDTTFSSQFAEFELHGFVMDVSPSQVLI